MQISHSTKLSVSQSTHLPCEFNTYPISHYLHSLELPSQFMHAESRQLTQTAASRACLEPHSLMFSAANPMMSSTRNRPIEINETTESGLEYFLLLCSSVNLTRFEIPNSFMILFCLFSQIIKDSSIIIRMKDTNFIIKAAFYRELSFPSDAELLNT